MGLSLVKNQWKLVSFCQFNLPLKQRFLLRLGIATGIKVQPTLTNGNTFVTAILEPVVQLFQMCIQMLVDDIRVKP